MRQASPRRNRAFNAALLLSILCYLTFFSLGALSAQEVTTPCLVPSVALTEEQSAEQLSMLRIESKKAGQPWNWVTHDRVESCDPGGTHLLFIDPSHALLERADLTPKIFNLEEISEDARARTLARWVVIELEPHHESDTPLALLESMEPLEAEEEDPQPAKDWSWLFWARAGFAFQYQIAPDRAHLGSVMETGVSLFDTLSISLAWSHLIGPEEGHSLIENPNTPYYTGSSLDGEIRTMTDELVLMAKREHSIDPMKVRVGAGLGWRHINLDSGESELPNYDLDQVMVALDLELLWHFSDLLYTSALVGGRMSFGEGNPVSRNSFLANEEGTGSNFSAAAITAHLNIGIQL